MSNVHGDAFSFVLSGLAACIQVELLLAASAEAPTSMGDSSLGGSSLRERAAWVAAGVRLFHRESALRGPGGAPTSTASSLRPARTAWAPPSMTSWRTAARPCRTRAPCQPHAGHLARDVCILRTGQRLAGHLARARRERCRKDKDDCDGSASSRRNVIAELSVASVAPAVRRAQCRQAAGVIQSSGKTSTKGGFEFVLTATGVHPLTPVMSPS